MPRALTLLIAGAAVLIAFRLLALWHSPLELQFDEAQYWSWAQNPAFGYYSKPPLLAWIIAGSTALCGDGEACVRMSAPLIHAITAALVALLARALGQGIAIAAVCGIAYLTLPAVGLGSFVLSTDTPLLLFWTLGLIAAWRWRKSTGWSWSVMLGCCIGAGLLAKYAMLYFLLGLGLFAALDPAMRRRLVSKQGAAVPAVVLLILTPHLLWNAGQGWPTFLHTADNANWQADLGGPLSSLTFLGSQALILGPLLFAAVIGLLIHLFSRRRLVSETERFLLCFSLPVIVIVSMQAFLSRANANWAAPAAIGLVVLVVIWLNRLGRRRLLAAAIGVNACLCLTLVIMTALGPSPLWPASTDAVMHRMTGWRTLGDQLAARVNEQPSLPVVFTDRKTMASALYYARAADAERFRRRVSGDGRPMDHYALTRPFKGEEEILLATTEFPANFRINGPISHLKEPTVRNRNRHLMIARGEFRR